MGENAKTITYVGAALVLGLVAILARPGDDEIELPSIVGQPLFENFTDPAKAADLEIVRYAEDVGEVQTLEVAKNAAGAWTIPSHGNYPADAQNQMTEAANALIGLTVLGVASQDQQDHQLFGVLEPNKEKLKLGDKGVGLLVSFKDEKGDSLGRMVVGHQVKNTTDQRFVRIPNQDPVYVVKFDPTKLSTKFEDWIEKDLLKLSTFDVEQLRLKDYSVLPTTQGYSLQPRSDIAVAYNNTDAKWELKEMITFKGREASKAQLLEGEELNKEKLDEVKNSLDDVKIVDVFAKPKGLGASLKASGDLAKDTETRRSLEARGFILDQNNELFSANGELHVLLKDGVEYVMRFGNVAGEEEESAEGKLNRYLFVTARVDESKFPAPELEPLPGEEPAVPSPAAPAQGAAKEAASSGACGEAELEQDAAALPPAGQDEKPVEAVKPDEAKPAEAKSEETKSEDAKPADAQSDETKAGDAKPSDAKPAGDASAADAPPAKPDAQALPADAKPEAASEEELKKKKLEAERERITKENQRKLDAWKENKTKAEEKVRELNGRFGDWYYVISEDVYKKLHLGRSDIIKEGAKSAEEGTGVDAFRALEESGLEKKAETK